MLFGKYSFESVPLLTAEEEKSLSLQIKKGGKKGQAARKKFIEANIRLVIMFANKFSASNGVDIEDLINEGNIGLAKAVDKFDGSKGNRFSTYAVWWIKQGIMRYIADLGGSNQSPIRVPQHVYTLRNNILKYITEYERTNEDAPTDEEIGLKFDLDRVVVRRILVSGQSVSSLDADISSDGDSEFALASIIADEKASDPCRDAESSSERKHMLMFLSRLTKKESKILKFRFGIETGSPMTLDEIGGLFKITRERVRQIEFKAMRKLRNLISKSKEVTK
jgi:RNA polymerase primary sigma factor